MITLEIQICNQRRSYVATFEGNNAETTALAFLATRSATHAFHEMEDFPIESQYTQLLDYLYPTCEHGLSLSNCNGPQHYYYDEEEQARGMRNW